MSPLNLSLVVSDTGHHCGGELWRGGVSLGTASGLTSIRSVSIHSRFEYLSRSNQESFAPNLRQGQRASKKPRLNFLIGPAI